MRRTRRTGKKAAVATTCVVTLKQFRQEGKTLPRLADRKQVLSFDKTPWPRSGNYSPDIPDEQA
jgi:hypothetical protein